MDNGAGDVCAVSSENSTTRVEVPKRVQTRIRIALGEYWQRRGLWKRNQWIATDGIQQYKEQSGQDDEILETYSNYGENGERSRKLETFKGSCGQGNKEARVCMNKNTEIDQDKSTKLERIFKIH